ncbi:MAG: hypothetical protein K2W95_04120 [Candidatus Obscuribacterales bacterium]|nr:hypothetical protein [Candidatus Obscuribacterales bacterium]
MVELLSRLDYQSLGGPSELVKVFDCSPCRFTLVARARFGEQLEKNGDALAALRTRIQELPDPDIVSRVCVMAAEKDGDGSNVSSSGSDIQLFVTAGELRLNQVELLRAWSKIFLLSSPADKYFYSLASLAGTGSSSRGLLHSDSAGSSDRREQMESQWVNLCTGIYRGPGADANDLLPALVVARALDRCLSALPEGIRLPVHEDASRKVASVIDNLQARSDALLRSSVKNSALSQGVRDSALKLLLAYSDTSTLELSGITELNLSFEPWGNSTLTKLACLPDLQRLNLTGTGVSSDGLEILRWLAKLRSLQLRSTLTHDYGVRHLMQCALQELDLRDTGVTDAGIPYLSAMKRLRKLDLRETNVSAQGIVRLRQELPACDVVFDLQDVT